MTMDSDYDILEGYLDNSLSPDEMQAVAARLAADPDLAAAIDALREERRLRQSAWQSYEPDEASAQRFAVATVRALRRQRILSMMRHFTRLAVSAAACLALGISAGWFIWGRPIGSVPVTATITGPTSSLASNSSQSSGAGTYQVAITDQNGKVVAVQKFNGLDEAKAFADDLGRYEQRKLDVQDGKATLVSDKF
jgi:hypothetical protein